MNHTNLCIRHEISLRHTPSKHHRDPLLYMVNAHSIHQFLICILVSHGIKYRTFLFDFCIVIATISPTTAANHSTIDFAQVTPAEYFIKGETTRETSIPGVHPSGEHVAHCLLVLCCLYCLLIIVGITLLTPPSSIRSSPRLLVLTIHPQTLQSTQRTPMPPIAQYLQQHLPLSLDNIQRRLQRQWHLQHTRALNGIVEYSIAC
mmetsp:Transcript_11802/g.25968  ORF Transcript_11802/g.25968 Transcript_11802/m.25968 type:complete len:204 (-) Transcript_11802:72-683(-)